MSTWERGRNATAPSRSTVAALHLVEDRAVDALLGLEGLLELHPRLFAAGLVTGDDGLAQRILDALDIDLDLVTDDDDLVAVRAGKFFESDATFGLGADIDDRDVLFDRDHLALHDRAFADLVRAEGSSSRAAKSSRLGCCKAADIKFS